MKNVSNALLIVSLIFVFSACTFHFPYDWDWDYSEYRVILKVEPDDAHVLLNGKWIGEAYEFSTYASALRLKSRRNELIIKKEGYVEEAIDLYDYDTRKIVIQLKLLKDKDYTGPAKSKKPARKAKPEEAEKKPGYKAKTEPVKELPPEPKEESKQLVKPVDVILEIHPEESSIYLNGKFWGISPKEGKIENLRLKPGQYTLEVVKPGYQDYKREIEVKEQKLDLIIKLEKK
ncbi:MAG: PEGA domain-containing protein [Candidatus Aminicenantes bacterium]|nr:MAG: PEGA domain-containing protein [Candidatus Aminicenantes bacterium]